MGKIVLFGHIFIEVAQILWLGKYFFPLMIKFGKKWVGTHFGPLFHKLIWSPCPRPLQGSSVSSGVLDIIEPKTIIPNLRTIAVSQSDQGDRMSLRKKSPKM
jgi:hypothetical protein